MCQQANFYQKIIQKIKTYNKQNKLAPSKAHTMKKVYDWNIPLSIHIQNNNKIVNIVCSVHTMIHQLKLELCKKLNLMIFDTQIDLYANGWRPMKPTSTLSQNGIQKGQARIKAVIKRQKKNKALEAELSQSSSNKKQKKNNPEGCGLELVATCTNQSCINYEQDTKIHIGYGTFPFFNLISDLKCELCPYRSQYLRPKMMCKDVKLSYANYKLEGKKTDEQGIPSDVLTKFITIKQPKSMLKKILSNQWDRDFILIVKHL